MKRSFALAVAVSGLVLGVAAPAVLPVSPVSAATAVKPSAATTAAPQAIRVTTPGATTVPPDMTKVCLGKFFKMRSALKAATAATGVQEVFDTNEAWLAAQGAWIDCMQGS